MNSILVKPNQTFLDVVIMGCGTLQGAMTIAAANGLAITDHVAVGQAIVIPDDVTTNTTILSFFQQNGIVVGTRASQWEAAGFVDETGIDEFVRENDDAFIHE